MSFEQRLGEGYETLTNCDSCEERTHCAPFDDKNQKESSIYLCEMCVLGMTITGFKEIE
jgi:hypothetical protein